MGWELGGGHTTGGGRPLLQPGRPQVPSPSPPRHSWRQRWFLGSQASLPTPSRPAPNKGLSICLFSILPRGRPTRATRNRVSRGAMDGGERTEWQWGVEWQLVLDFNSGWVRGGAQSGSDSPLPSPAPGLLEALRPCTQEDKRGWSPKGTRAGVLVGRFPEEGDTKREGGGGRGGDSPSGETGVYKQICRAG